MKTVHVLAAGLIAAAMAPLSEGVTFFHVSSRVLVAPGGNAVVWGQSGIGPHARDERHFIPSIEPYLRVLDDFAERLMGEG